MRNARLAVSATACAAWVIGCGGAPPSLKTGMHAIERDVQETTPVTLSDLDPVVVAAWTTKHPHPVAAPKSLDDLSPSDRVVQEIQWGQCQSKSANPLVPVVSGAFTLALQGNLTWGGSAGASEGATGPGATLGVTFTVSKQQTVTVPVTFVTAANLGTFYMSQMMAFFANTPALSSWPPPGVASWPTPPVLPQPPSPTQANAQMSVGPVSPPPAPGSQFARIQASIERALQTRDAIDAATKRAIDAYPPAAPFCDAYRKTGFVPVVFPVVE
jgi:hypothetical protein